MNSDNTPRTDAVAQYTGKLVPADFARTLERELGAANEQRDALRNEFDRREAVINQLRSALTASRVECGRLREEVKLVIEKANENTVAHIEETGRLREEAGQLAAALEDAIQALERVRTHGALSCEEAAQVSLLSEGQHAEGCYVERTLARLRAALDRKGTQ